MKFFNSKIASDLIDNKYFITSEKFEMASFIGPRLFTLREAKEDGSIKTIGQMQGYITLKSAKEALDIYIKTGNIAPGLG
jgi:hypothetical protein